MTGMRSYRAIIALVAIVYALLLILTHDVFQQLSLELQRSVGIRTWNTIFMLVSATTGVTLLVFALRRLRAHDRAPVLKRFAIALVLLGLLVIEGLMVKYVETVHFVQYAMMALLLYPIVGRASGAIILAVLIGLVDEWYQFHILYPGRGALDINDCVMNTVGSLIGGFLAVVFDDESTRDTVRSAGSARVWLGGWIFFWGLVLALSFTPVAGVFADSGQLTYFKKRTTEQGLPERRIRRTGAGKHWYQLMPQEGLGLIFVLPIAFAGLDRSRKAGAHDG